MKPDFIPSRILIVRLGALGDIVHALPAQQLLRREFPDSRIHWLAEAAYSDLLHCVPGIDRVWIADTQKWRRKPTATREILNLARRLRRENFDLAFDFQGLLKSAILSRLAGATRVLGFRPERFKEKGITLLYDLSIEGEADLSRHVISTNLRLAGQVVKVTAFSPRVDFEIPEADRQVVEQNLRRLGIRRPVLINPGAGWVTKLWPAADYGRLGLRIERELGLPVLYNFGPGEEELLREIRLIRRPRPTPTFPTTLPQLAHLCRQSCLVIGGDCGPLHLAVAVGTPAVAVLGPTAPERNGPANPEDIVVRRLLPCSNSYKRRCDEFICMEIPVQTVLEAVQQRLAVAEPVGKAEALSAVRQSP